MHLSIHKYHKLCLFVYLLRVVRVYAQASDNDIFTLVSCFYGSLLNIYTRVCKCDLLLLGIRSLSGINSL